MVLVDLVGFGIVLPLLPSYAARYTDNVVLIGALVASDSLMQFLLAPWWGRLSDRIGRRPVLLIGFAGSVAAYLLFGLAGSLFVLLLSRVVSGGTGATVNVAQAYLADVTEPEHRSRAMGMIGAAFGLGFTIGPALGGITSRFGDAAPGLLAAGLAAVNLVVAWRLLPETRVHRPAPVRQAPAEWRTLVSPFGAMFCTTLAFTVMYVVFPLYCQRVLGYDRDRVSYLFVFLGLVTIVVQGRLVGPLARRFGERRLIVTGSLALAAGFAVLPLAGSPPVFLGGILSLATGYSLAGPSLAGLVSRTTAAGEQGRALGALQSVGSVARIVGPPAAGVISEVAGIRAPFLAAAAAAVVAGIFAGSARRNPRAEKGIVTAAP